MDAACEFAFTRDDGVALALPRSFECPLLSRTVHTSTRPRAAIATSGVLSFSLHALAAIALMMTWERNELGVLQQPTEAISIEFIASPVLEQALVDVTQTQSGETASVAQQAGAETESAAASTAEEVKAEETLKAEPATDALHPSVPPVPFAQAVEPSDTVIAGTAEVEDSLPPPAAEEKRTEREEEKKPAREEQEKPKKKAEKASEKPKQPTQKAETDPSKKGGAASRASSSTKAGSGRVSASSGDIAGYAARVRARVAGNRPSSGGKKGTVVVSFGVSSSGGLTYVRLGRSSGVPALDQAVLSAVWRAAPFPPPPAGTPSSRLGFAVPFYFR